MFQIKVDYLKIIFIILASGVIGGIIAFLGNQLGRYIGRKKLSVFKLRPRYTSMLITILTGMMIAMLAITISVIVSEPLRGAISGIEQVMKDVNDYEKMVSQKLQEEQKKQILYKYEDIILSAVIKPQSNLDLMKGAIKELVAQANDVAVKKARLMAERFKIPYQDPPEGKLVGYIPENLDSVSHDLSRLKSNQVIFIRAHQNALLGQRFYIQISEPIPNRLIFPRNIVIYRITVNGNEPYHNIIRIIKSTIHKEIATIAISAGIFPDPENGYVGETDEDYINGIAEKIQKIGKNVILEFRVKEDTYIRGPLRLVIDIKQ
jgi:hypothetical protein